MFNLKKSTIGNSLYVAQQPLSYEHILQHCLWKLLSETGFLYHQDLTEMESIVVTSLVNKKYASGNAKLPVDSDQALGIFNSAIDKILAEVKRLQLQSQKYHSIAVENRALKNGLRGLIKDPVETGSFIPSSGCRLIDDIGLSRRTVRILKANGIDTLDKLRTCSLFRLRKQQRVGVKTIHEIQTALSRYSVHQLDD